MKNNTQNTESANFDKFAALPIVNKAMGLNEILRPCKGA